LHDHSTRWAISKPTQNTRVLHWKIHAFFCANKPIDLEALTHIASRRRQSMLNGFPRSPCEALTARSILQRGFQFIDARFADARSGEIDLLKTFRALLAVVPNYAVLLQGEAFDLGKVEGYHYFRGRFAASSS
jgi:hypothetical protein